MLVFQSAQPADIPLLRTLAARIWRESYPGTISPEQIEYMLGWMYSEEKIAAELTGGVHWEVVRTGAAAAGYWSATFPGSGASAGGAPADLHKLYLLPEYHGRGWGQAILARVVTHARESGCRRVRLRVNKQNARALRSYTRAGFVIIDSVVAEIGGGFVMDDYLLEHATPAEP